MLDQPRGVSRAAVFFSRPDARSHPKATIFFVSPWQDRSPGRHNFRTRATVIETEYIGLAAGIFTACSMMPQLIKLIRNKKSEELSLTYLMILFAGIALWVWYGTLRDDIPIIATNAVSLFLNTLMIILAIRYKRNTQ